MKPREIIATAWAVTKKESGIRRWSFVSSFLETLLSLKLLTYQAYFAYEYFHGGQAGFFDIEIMLYQSVPFGVFVSIMVLFVLLLATELIFPHLCTGAIIGLAAKSHLKEKVEGGAVLGLYNFFSIFAIHESLMLAGLSTCVTVTSLIIRYVDGGLRWWTIGMVWILFIFSNILRFLVSFANQAVVLNRVNVFEAIGKSLKLIISNLSHVMFLMLLLIVISLRIILNVAIVIVIPGLVVGLGILLTYILSRTISYTIAGILGITLTFVASYFLAYLHAFKHTVWTITYLELSKKKDLDVIL